MDTFHIVKRKDEEKFGTYRTKDTILEIYDAMSEATRTAILTRLALTCHQLIPDAVTRQRR
jgi:hypothetical protein